MVYNDLNSIRGSTETGPTSKTHWELLYGVLFLSVGDDQSSSPE